jgi:hypothetical protein
MGGKLLPNWDLPEKRIPRDAFDNLCAEILAELRKDWSGCRIEVIPFLHSKQDFGDVDILIESLSGEKIDWKAYFAGKFDKHIPHVNGSTISIPVKDFQVDFCFIGSESYETAKGYYSYEVGNFMGRIARPMGLRYGHKNLRLQIPLNQLLPSLPDHQFADFIITKDTEEIHNILGFDYEAFRQGFNIKMDLFDWVVSSKNFDSKLFKLENLDHQTRTRNRKRPLWSEFLEWIQEYPERAIKLDKAAIAADIRARYPHLEDLIAAKKIELEKSEARKAKFNGKIVCEILGIEPSKELGDFIISFKKFVAESYEDFEVFLDSHTKEYIIEEIKKHEHDRSK